MNAFPFDSQLIGYDDNGMPLYDRASNAEEFARLLHAFLTDGVFGAEMCEVLEAGGMAAQVGIGNMMIQGRYGYISQPETVNFAAANATNPRIDTVVLRLDLSSDVNNIVTAVVTGAPSSTPVAPLLTRDGTIWELGIADVLIPANSSAVYQANITDTRLDDARCGIVAAVLSDFDTSVYQAQFEAIIKRIQADLQAVYDGVEKVNLIERSAVLLADNWFIDIEAPCHQTVEVEGVLGADRAIVDCDLSAAITAEEMTSINDAWGSVLKAESGAGTVTVYFSDVPDIDIPIKIMVVR